MPKEDIDDLVTPGFRVEVCWSAGQYVQVATTNAHSTLTLPPDDQPRPSGQPPTASTRNPPPGSDRIPFDGWFTTLDRDGCNRMIRALRRARDSAFGEDE